MVDDQVYLQGMHDLRLAMTEDEIHTFALNRFAPPGAPLIPPSPTATLTAERAAMATSTAASLFATPVESPVAGTPIASTPVSGTLVAGTPLMGTPVVASPIAATPAATPLDIVP